MIRDYKSRNSDRAVDHQASVGKAARLLVQSATQTHPILALDHAMEARFIMDRVVNQYGSTKQAEEALKLEKYSLSDLHNQIKQQSVNVQDYVMAHVIRDNSSLNLKINPMAGFTNKNKRIKNLSEEVL